MNGAATTTTQPIIKTANHTVLLPTCRLGGMKLSTNASSEPQKPRTADEPHQSVAFAADAERARGLFHIVTQIDGAAEHQQIHDEVKQYGEL